PGDQPPGILAMSDMVARCALAQHSQHKVCWRGRNTNTRQGTPHGHHHGRWGAPERPATNVFACKGRSP
ncbi:MAG TPA: hypothetical protein VKQ36_03215, partial [Ktedonobacterales bacterium]|nr:hypothetical protein [Ktedonobacterales bacterium]